MEGIYILDVDAWTGAAVETLRLSTKTFVTKPTDTPANTVYWGLISDVGALERYLFRDGGISGSPSSSYGAIEFSNADGKLDSWLDYGFDGRAFRLSFLRVGAPIASATLVALGTVLHVDTANASKTLKLQIRDRLAALDKPLLVARYAGTTITQGPTAEGNADLRDQIKPRIFGAVFNVQPTLVNEFDLIYQVSDSAILSIEVYDGGVPLVLQSDYSSLATMIAATVTPGTYSTCLALGCFKLGGSPALTVTADAVEGGPGQRSAARVAERMLDAVGVGLTARNSATFDAVHAFNPAEVGILVSGDTTALELIGEVLNSVGAGILPNAAATLELFVFQAPTGAPAVTYTRRDVISDGFTITPSGGSDEGQGIPAWSLILTYARIWRTQTSGEVAGVVSDARKAYLEKSDRQVTAQDATVKIAHPLASEITIATLLTQAADALVEVARRIGLYKVRRDRLVFPVPFDRAIEVGQIAEVKMRRFGYGGGKLFVVTGRRDDFRKRVATLEMWG